MPRDTLCSFDVRGRYRTRALDSHRGYRQREIHNATLLHIHGTYGSRVTISQLFWNLIRSYGHSIFLLESTLCLRMNFVLSQKTRLSEYPFAEVHYNNMLYIINKKKNSPANKLSRGDVTSWCCKANVLAFSIQKDIITMYMFVDISSTLWYVFQGIFSRFSTFFFSVWSLRIKR